MQSVSEVTQANAKLVGKELSDSLLLWYHQAGRRNLPWQGQEPYRVWLSEVMLQQTQVQIVIPYYQRFLEHFPTVADLAAASLDAVMAQWSGLGYYSRARNLHRAAQKVMQEYAGQFPSTAAALQTLPGVGRSTAAAIAAFCFKQRVAICDANVRRVLSRYYGLTSDRPAAPKRLDQLAMWQLAEASLPAQLEAMPAYTQAIMDVGALLCTARTAQCPACPLQTQCSYRNGAVSALAGGVAKQAGRAPGTAASLRKKLPMHWAFIRNSLGQLLLERRPAPGIWAGLFCVPSWQSEAVMLHGLAQLASGLRQQPRLFAQTRHVLTHRDLAIHCWDVVWPADSDCPGGLWHRPVDVPARGIPAALRRVLPLWQAHCGAGTALI